VSGIWDSHWIRFPNISSKKRCKLYRRELERARFCMPQSFTDAERASPNGTAAQSKTPLHDTDHGANSKSASFPSPRSGPSASTVDPRGFPHGSNFAQKLPRKSQLSTKLCPPLCPCAERSVNAANAVHLATPLLCSPSTRDRSGTLRWPSGPNGATDDHFNFQHRSRLQVPKLGGRKGRGTHQPTSPTLRHM
jgi:hypothetical protein